MSPYRWEASGDRRRKESPQTAVLEKERGVCVSQSVRAGHRVGRNQTGSSSKCCRNLGGNTEQSVGMSGERKGRMNEGSIFGNKHFITGG